MARLKTKIGKAEDRGAPIVKSQPSGNGRDKTGGELGHIFRELIKRDGRSLAQLSKDCGIPSGKLSRFMRGEASLTLKTVDALMKGLRLRLVGNSPSEGTPSMSSIAEYAKDRSAADLEEKLAKAKESIQIVTTRMTPVGSLGFLRAIMEAVHAGNGKPEVTILASHPENKHLAVRARQLGVREAEYRQELRKVLNYIATVFEPEPNCKLLVYREFPLQVWYRIDGVIHVNIPSLGRPTSKNCVFSVGVETPGVQETFLDYFQSLLGQPTTGKYVVGNNRLSP